MYVIDRDLIRQVDPTTLKPLPYAYVGKRLPFLVEPEDNERQTTSSSSSPVTAKKATKKIMRGTTYMDYDNKDIKIPDYIRNKLTEERRIHNEVEKMRSPSPKTGRQSSV